MRGRSRHQHGGKDHRTLAVPNNEAPPSLQVMFFLLCSTLFFLNLSIEKRASLGAINAYTHARSGGGSALPATALVAAVQCTGGRVVGGTREHGIEQRFSRCAIFCSFSRSESREEYLVADVWVCLVKVRCTAVQRQYSSRNIKLATIREVTTPRIFGS